MAGKIIWYLNRRSLSSLSSCGPHSFIHSMNICGAPTVCQELFQAMGVQWEARWRRAPPSVLLEVDRD